MTANHAMLVGVSIIVFALASSLVKCENEQGLPFNGRSFSVKSLVSTTIYQTKEVIVSQQREQYSIEQSRARIDFVRENKILKKGDKFPTNGKIIHSSQTDTSLLVGNFDGEHCRSSSRQELFELLHGIEAKEFANELEDFTDSGGKFVVGPAKWIFFIAKHRQQLAQLQVGQVKLKVRNIPSNLYELQVNNSALNFTVYFSETLDANLDAQLPSRILILGKEFNTAIDYLIYKQEDRNSNQLIEQLTVGQPPFEALLDPFNFGQFPGCSSQIKEQIKRSNFLLPRPPNWSRFSFRAKVNLMRGLVGTYVAGDAILNIMRLDLTSAPSGITSVRRQVFDFGQNRMYHAMQLEESSEIRGVTHEILALSDRLTRRQVNEQGQNRSAIVQCMISPIMPSNRWLNPADQSTLVGSFNKLLPNIDGFLYVGLARVGGIEAHVFEAHKGLTPFWIDQALRYRTPEGEFKVRMPDVGVTPDPGRVSAILAYFGSENGGGAANKLLLVEIYALYEGVLQVVDKQSVLIEDFTWDLEGPPNGDSINGLFSLEDFCSAGSDSNEYAEVDLILEDADNGAQSVGISFELAKERNLALLTGLQRDFNLHVPMIYDLKSSSSLTRQGGHFVSGSFKIAQHSNELVELLYLGQGRLLDAQQGKIATLFTRSFQACFFLAAHRGKNLYFGYHLKTRLCHIFPDPVTSGGIIERSLSFQLGQQRVHSLEIYKTRHVVDQTNRDEANWIALATRASNEKNNFLGKRISLVEAKSNRQSAMIVKRFQVTNSDYRRSIGHRQITTANEGNVSEQFSRLDKIPGFGLSGEDVRWNRVYLPPRRQLTSASDSSLDLVDTDYSTNYEQCHLACIADFTCKSFSVCVRNSETQCVLSGASFRSGQLVQQLVELRNSPAARREFKVKLTLEGELGEIDLVEYPTCDLYNKNFLDLFKLAQKAQKSFTRRRLYQVENREHCARLCATQSLAVIGNSSQFLAQLDHSMASNNIGQHLSGESKSLLETWRAQLGELCRVFLYLDKSTSVSQSTRSNISARLYPLERSLSDYGEEMTKQVSEDQFEGYCMLNDRAGAQETNELIEYDRLHEGAKNEYLEFEVSTFKTEFFYDKQYGVRLLGSAKSSQEFVAYELIKKNSSRARAADYTLLKAFIERGENSQSSSHASVEVCAQTCLMQTWEKVWPACRSFDIVSSIESGSQIYFCYLNSVTLGQVRALGRHDLIDANSSSNVQMWHYEPKNGVQLLETGYLEAPISSYSHRFRLVAVIFLGLLGALSGLVVGAKLAQRMIINQRGQQTNVSFDPLVSLMK